MYKKRTGNNKRRKDAGNRTLCPYRNFSQAITNFIEYVESTFIKFNKDKHDVFLMGDFNIDLLPYDSHSYTNDFANTMIWHLFSTLHSPTVSSYRPFCYNIDNIFSNITDFETLSGNITVLVADHFAQFELIKKCYISYKSCSYSVYDYSNFAIEKFIHDFSLLDWSFLHNYELSADDKFDNLYTKSITCIDSDVPKKKITRRNKKLRTKPW